MTIDPTRREIFLAGTAAALAGGCRVASAGTEDAQASTQSEIRALLADQSEAMRVKDIDRLMSFYSPDVVYFDTVPPLQYAGAAALRGRFLQWFDTWKGPIGMEVRSLDILASGDVAVAHWLNRASGTLKDGREVGSWVRATSCCQRSAHKWLITHEHVSWPVDPKSGSAAKDLVP
jgi:ketosteroid isomerase-like protein